MLEKNVALYVHDTEGIVHSNDPDKHASKKHGRKACSGKYRKNSLRTHPFLPKELTDRILAFTNSFGLKVILLAKAGKLAYSNKPVRFMSAYCCIYYIENNTLKVGLARYYKGKISLYDSWYGGHAKWIENFELSYRNLAEEMQYSVMYGSVEPLVMPGLFLKSNDVKNR